MVTVKHRKGESFDSLYRRFSRRVQQSGKLLEVKKVRFRTPESNKARVKKSALRRLAARTKREYLIRTGQLVEAERLIGGGGRGRSHH